MADEIFVFDASFRTAFVKHYAAEQINDGLRLAHELTEWSGIGKPLTPAGCVCGAAALGHKGRGAGHSSWCDMAKTGGA